MRLAYVVALAAAASLIACTSDSTTAGLATNVKVVTWDLSKFPLTDESPSVIAQLITDRQYDLIAVQEIRDEAALNTLVAAAPGYAGVLAPASNTTVEQRVGFIWRTSRLLVEDTMVLFPDDTDFLRPPLLANVRRIGAGAPVPAFTAIVLQLAAGASTDNISTRANAINKVATHAATLGGGPTSNQILVLGDFAVAPTDADATTTMAPFLTTSWEAPTFSTSAAFTYVPDKTAIDHVFNSAALAAQRANAQPVVERLDQTVTAYNLRVSDHLPLLITFPFEAK